MSKQFKLSTIKWGVWIYTGMAASSTLMAFDHKAFEEPLPENILIPAQEVTKIKWLSWLEVSDKYLSLPDYYKQKTLESSPSFVHTLASSFNEKELLNLADEAFGIQENILWLQKATDFVRRSKIYSLGLNHRIIQKATILKTHCSDVYESRFKSLLASIAGESAGADADAGARVSVSASANGSPNVSADVGAGSGASLTPHSQIEFTPLILTKHFKDVEIIFADGIPLNIQNRKVLIPKIQSTSISLSYWLISAQHLPLEAQYNDLVAEKLTFQPIVSGNCKESQWNWPEQRNFAGQLFFSSSCVRPLQNPEVLHPRPIELEWQSKPLESEKSAQIKKWTIMGIVGGALAYMLFKK